MIRRIKFVGVPVRDQDRALDFYVNTLGFTLQTDQPMGPGQRWIEIRPPKGETGIALFTSPGHEDRGDEHQDEQTAGAASLHRGFTLGRPPLPLHPPDGWSSNGRVAIGSAAAAEYAPWPPYAV